MSRRTGPARAMALAVIVSACGGASQSAPGPAPAAACMPVDGALDAGATLAGRAGAYRLEMVAEDGDRRSTGTLTLVEQPESMRNVAGAASTLYGSTTVRPPDVGAPTIGGLDSMDPAAPGVLVLERDRDEGRSVLLTLGSALNRRDVTLFDAASVALDVRRIDADGFAGAWRGEVWARSSRGYFCAVRQAG